jgi:hypothetical protein
MNTFLENAVYTIVLLCLVGYVMVAFVDAADREAKNRRNQLNITDEVER